jgi:phospholipid/cholesterol/gamma-HCH transport system ATP-binding protein
MAEWNEPIIPAPIISLRGIVNRFGPQVVHDGVDLDIKRGEVMGIVGGSGSGKSVLLRTIIGLNRPAEGSIEVLGKPMLDLDERERREIEERWGVLFQNGALFSSLTVVENIETPLKEHTNLPPELRREIAELSGGMKKRAGLARALALDPEILFLDEPTAGLDPIGAAEFDELIQSLQQSLGLTVVMITHDLDSLAAICDRIAVLVDKRVKVGTLAELQQDDHPWIRSYFHGPRARAAGIGVTAAEPQPAT